MMNNLHNCFSLDLHPPPLNFPSSAVVNHNPKKRRTNLLRIAAPAPKPTRKPDPSAPKITRPCSECGKRFWSWKALFGHMRCHPDRQWRGINPPPNFRPPPGEEEEEVAACLLILANQGECSRKEEEEGCCGGHKCSVCMRVFSSGQALGGHKRCHREIIASTSRVCGFDLNLPFDHPYNDNYSSSLDLRLRL